MLIGMRRCSEALLLRNQGGNQIEKSSSYFGSRLAGRGLCSVFRQHERTGRSGIGKAALLPANGFRPRKGLRQSGRCKSHNRRGTRTPAHLRLLYTGLSRALRPGAAGNKIGFVLPAFGRRQRRESARALPCAPATKAANPGFARKRRSGDKPCMGIFMRSNDKRR